MVDRISSGKRAHLAHRRVIVAAMIVLLGVGCGDDGEGAPARAASSIYSFADGCFAVEAVGGAGGARFLARSPDGSAYAFPAPGAAATPFFFKATGLGTYLLFDEAQGYLASDGSRLVRLTELGSDLTTLNDAFVSEAEWELQASASDPAPFRLRHRKSGLYLADGMLGAADGAAALRMQARSDCAVFPEESTHTAGRVVPRQFGDGSVFGFVDAHSHLLANFAFGGAGIFHGAPFHRLGVQHALMDCTRFHGAEGRADLFGYAFDLGADASADVLLQGVLTGRTPTFNHHTDGYPTFTEWPSAVFRSTHQVQYYKWLERAYLGGLRLVVQLAVSNQIICDFLGGGGIQPVRYSCNDMVAVDRQVTEAYAMQDYIDAQEGGPGRGWFRIVTTPAQAREVIRSGKMAVLLGIETSNLFDCFLTPRAGFPRCTEADVVARLDDYYERGVRAIFPVHKYDNGFSAGDGHKSFIEIGNLLQTSHFSNFSEQCDPSVPTAFDRGPMSFPGLNRPRADYFAPPPNDFSEFYRDPVRILGPIVPLLFEPPIPGVEDHCQTAGLTPLGEFLIGELMRRGMIVELDHLPRKSYKRAFELLVANDYPAAGTHGLDNFGRLYALGGISTSNFARCRAASERATVDDGFQARLRTIVENGGFPGLGFGLDLNGFAGAPGPRFGPKSVCGGRPQSDPLAYPFTSYAGDVTFLRPMVGNRPLDFNTEGLVHIGLLPDLIEDVRRDGVSDADLEPLFKSAEAYLRMWEKAERRGAALRGAGAMASAGR
jgi:microsomal dipeptidase-like Zn-dependent dipeptidase